MVDLEDGTQWPLLAQRGVLSRYWMRIDHREEQRVSTALLFAATVEDTNGDGKLNSLDAVRALRTDPDGRNPRLISPAGTQLHDVLFDPVADVAVLMIATDTDRDGKFSVKERVEPFLLELGSDQPLRRLISPETKAAVEAALTGS